MDDSEAKLKALRLACSANEDRIQQILGKALGFPWYKDDQKNFPGATEEDGVCVGHYVAEDLAIMAADLIEKLRKETK